MSDRPTKHEAEPVSVFRDRSLSYLELPAPDVDAVADFYQTVFGWVIGGDRRDSFTDGSGHVIGHFVADLGVAGAAGPRPFVCVDDVDEAVRAVLAAGGRIVTPRYVEGDLWVATFADPAGNVLGVWQSMPADESATAGMRRA